MKALFTRILSLAVTLAVLLLPVSALAEERDMASLTLSNFAISLAEPDGTLTELNLPLSLSMNLGLDMENEQPRGVLSADLSAGGQSALGAMMSVDEEALRIRINGMDYGMYLPMEAVYAMAMQAELGGLETDAVLTAVENLLNALLSEDPASTVDLGLITTTEGTPATITLFDKTMTADQSFVSMEPMTLGEIIERMRELSNQSPVYAASVDLWDALRETAEFDAAIEDTVISMQGTAYAVNDMVVSVELALTIADSGSSVTLQLTNSSLVEAEKERSQLDLILPVDGEVMAWKLYSEETNDGTQSSNNTTLEISFSDEETGKVSETMNVGFYAQENADGTLVNVSLAVDDGIDPVTLAFTAKNGPVVSTAAADAWKGTFSLNAAVAEAGAFTIDMDTEFALTNMPDGTLVPAAEKDINLMDEDNEEALEAFEIDLQSVMTRALDVLASVPEIADIIGDMMM